MTEVVWLTDSHKITLFIAFERKVVYGKNTVGWVGSKFTGARYFAINQNRKEEGMSTSLEVPHQPPNSSEEEQLLAQFRRELGYSSFEWVRLSIWSTFKSLVPKMNLLTGWSTFLEARWRSFHHPLLEGVPGGQIHQYGGLHHCQYLCTGCNVSPSPWLHRKH